MKIVRFAVDKKVKYGILDGKTIQGIEGKPYRRIEPIDQHYQLSEVKLLPPCNPSKVIALGINYHSYAKELDTQIPNAPHTILKTPTAVIGPEENINYSTSTKRLDYEGELGVVIKKPAWRVSVENALDYVLGYTCFNDVTAHGLKSNYARWPSASNNEYFVAIGPFIETELDPKNVTVETYLNGELKQRGNTSDFIYSIPQLINFISGATSLAAGDIIATGTPSGNGQMQPGDTVEIKIAPIGTLRNYVIGDGKPLNPITTE